LENRYYPFGLTMAGISSKAAGKPESNKRFQGQEFAHKEFSDGSGLEMYEFKYRMDDPQTGRFWQIDPLAEKYVYNSPHAFSENKVTGHIELEGLESVNANSINNPYLRALAKDNVTKSLESMKRNASEAVEVKATAGVGIGVKAKAGGVGVDASLSGPQANVTVNGAGKVDADVSVAGAGVKVTTPIGTAKSGFSLGVVQFKDGKTTIDAATGGTSGSLSASTSKDVKVGNDLSQSVGAASGEGGTLTFGVKAGIFGAEVSANLKKGGAAVVDFFSGLVNYLENATQKLNNTSTSKNIPQ